MFASADSRNAVSGIVGDYNSFVTSEAALNSALPATSWHALISTTSVNAVSNVSCGATCDANVPIYLPDGTKVANSLNALFAGPFSHAPNEDQNGAGRSGFVFTGSHGDGTMDAGLQAGSGSGVTEVGDTSYSDSSAISVTQDGSTNNHGIYGLSAEIVTATPEPATGAALLTGGLIVTRVFRRRHTNGG